MLPLSQYRGFLLKGFVWCAVLGATMAGVYGMLNAASGLFGKRTETIGKLAAPQSASARPRPHPRFNR